MLLVEAFIGVTRWSAVLFVLLSSFVPTASFPGEKFDRFEIFIPSEKFMLL